MSGGIEVWYDSAAKRWSWSAYDGHHHTRVGRARNELLAEQKARDVHAAMLAGASTRKERS